jgi:cellulose synthase/poly-beta-1,6-N-acetylglucosamine synthase-like glycosyltransferase
MYFSPEHTEQIILILFVTFVTMASIQLIYTLLVHGSLLRKVRKVEDINYPPVSIVICARNESDNIFKNLPTILAQNYPKFEVIVVNHQSTDDSKYILHAFAQEYDNLRIIEIARNEHLKMGKKLPLSMGIKGAKYDKLLLTDADCLPSSNQWLKLMARNFSVKEQIVLGYSPHRKQPGFLNSLIRFDTTWIGMNYLGAARLGTGYMGVGRNMSYCKNLFEESKGFKSHYSILSGDDDLFFQEVANKRNYTVELDPDSFTYSAAKDSWEDWIIQKKRHLSTSPHYKVIKKLLLGTYPITLFFLLVTFVILLFEVKYRWITLGIFSFVFLLKWFVQGRCFMKLKERKLISVLPFMELLYFIILPVIYYGLNNKTKERWR